MAVWVQLSNFVFCCKKDEWPFGYNFKTLYFTVRKRMAVWVHALIDNKQSDFVFPCGKYEWPCKNLNARLGTVFKILYFAVKKQMAVWVHAFI